MGAKQLKIKERTSKTVKKFVLTFKIIKHLLK
jgi:hypothetical protein